MNRRETCEPSNVSSVWSATPMFPNRVLTMSAAGAEAQDARMGGCRRRRGNAWQSSFWA